MSPVPEIIAFGMWYCDCTMLAATVDDVPSRCPIHGRELIGRPSWERNPQGVALGLLTKEQNESWQRGYRIVGDPFDVLGSMLP